MAQAALTEGGDDATQAEEGLVDLARLPRSCVPLFYLLLRMLVVRFTRSYEIQSLSTAALD